MSLLFELAQVLGFSPADTGMRLATAAAVLGTTMVGSPLL